MKKFLLSLLLLLIGNVMKAQFSGHSGVYYLGSSDIPIPQSTYNNPSISGVVCRFRWENLETSPNVFNWSFIDGEIAKANIANKKICLQPLAYPSWVINTLGAQGYNYVDNNPYHSTYGQILTDVVSFDDIYINRVKNLILQLSIKYANNPTVSYINAIGGQISRGMPDTVVTNTTTLTTAPFWSTYNYNADTVASKMTTVIDYYMSLFPTTPLWCSVDYVTFEQDASNRPRNYLATQYTNYGIANYPDRFGLWREDISGCTTTTPNSGSQWSIMLNNPCRTGAQMLWNVQDGPTRMNQCGISPNTKQAVLDEAINKALFYGMRYVEVYGADIQDASLSLNIANANTVLNNQNTTCTLNIDSFLLNNDLKIFPNPASKHIQIQTNSNDKIFVTLYDETGRAVFSKEMYNYEIIDISTLSEGIYFVKINSSNTFKTLKLIIKK